LKNLLAIPILIIAAASYCLSQTPEVDTKSKGGPLAGTWKANLAKSKQHPSHQFQSATLVFDIAPDGVLLTFTGINMSGNKESGTRKLNPDGKEYPVAGAPGVLEMARWVDSRTLEVVAKKDGKVVGQGSYKVSTDGKRLTAKMKGIDASGAEFEQVIVFDRE
jgi:hypothetical protein